MTTVVSVAQGGTGASNTTQARLNLGITPASTLNVSANGGTTKLTETLNFINTASVMINVSNAASTTNVSFDVIAGLGFVRDSFVGNGSGVNFTLSGAPVNEDNSLVFVDRILQRNSEYNVSATTLTFTAAPDNGSVIDVFVTQYLGGNSAVLRTGDTMTGELNVSAKLITQNIEPIANITYNLGTNTKRFKDLYLSNSTIYLGDVQISANAGKLVVPAIETFSGINLESQVANSYTQANSAYGQANAAYGQANSAYGQANAAYGAANNRVLKAGDTMTGQLNISAGGLLVTGNVGIGTSSPAGKLEINGTSIDQLVLNDSTSTGNGNKTVSINAFKSGVGYHNLAINGYELRFSTGGSASEAARIDSSGNLGIGTTTPINKLSVGVASVSPGTAFLSTLGVRGGTLGGTAGNTAKIANFSFDSVTDNHAGLGITAYRNTTGNGWTTTGIKFTFDVDNSTAVYDNLLCFQGGNVGIGTSSPGQKLEVAGNIFVNTSGNPYAEIKTSGSGNNPYLKLTADTNSWTFQGTFSNANDDLLVLYNATTLLDLTKDGNLGLGVTPSAWKSTNPAFQIGQSGCVFSYSSTNIVGLGANFFINSAGDEKYITTNTAGFYRIFGNAHTWWIAPSGTAGNTITFTQAMTLDASGNLLVGTVSTGLAIAAPINISLGSTYADTAGTASKAKLRLFHASDGTVYGFGISNSLLETHVPSGAAAAWYINNTERMRITSQGYVQKPNQPAFSVYRVGVGGSTGVVVYTTTALNRGSHVNLGNGRFTAPIAGAYHFTFMCFQESGTSGVITGRFDINGVTTVIRFYQDDSDTGYGPHVTLSAILNLSAADYVTVNITSGTAHGNEDCFFSGFLIG